MDNIVNNIRDWKPNELQLIQDKILHLFDHAANSDVNKKEFFRKYNKLTKKYQRLRKKI